MQSVSKNWDKNQSERIITAPSFLELSIIVTDPEARASATSSASGETFWSDAETLVDVQPKAPIRYATLEHNLFVLDGSFKLLPDEAPYGDNGYISDELSGADASFAAPPTITISFPRVFLTSLEGLTITWGKAYTGEYASEFRVTAYNGSTAVAEKTVSGNTSVVSRVFLEMTGYDSIVVTILKWSLPVRRARITTITVGIEHVYQKGDLAEYKHTSSVDLLARELPTEEVSFRVDNSDLLYDPDNDAGLSKYLMERQEVTVTYGYTLGSTLETIPAAVVYLDEWETPRDGIFASFTARGATVYMNDKYTGASAGTLYEIASAAFTQAGLPRLDTGEQRWSVDTSLSSISAPSGVDLSGYTTGEVVQLCANAACCVLRQDRKGVFRILPFSPAEEAVYAITKGIEYGYPDTELIKQLRSVNINGGAYTLSVSAAGVEQPVNNPLISTDRAPTVAAWVRDMLLHRQSVHGEWRADPKVEPLDTVNVDTPFRTNKTVLTEVALSFNGAWRGTYEGTVLAGTGGGA